MQTPTPRTVVFDPDDMIIDTKYVVFKREQFYHLLNHDPAVAPVDWEKHILPDASVIRSQDVFAAPALHAYYNSILVAIEVLTPHIEHYDGLVEEIEQLRSIADYFHARATEAEAAGHHVPD